MTTILPVNSCEIFQEIASFTESYFELMYTCDLTLYDKVFYPNAHLYTLENGASVVRTSAEYRNLLAVRKSPQSNGDTRDERVHIIDLTSPTQALVKVQVRIGRAIFTDYLALLKVEEGWRIISKTYHRVPLG